MKCSVFVTEIIKGNQGIVVRATNGSDIGPPSVEWEIHGNPRDVHIGKAFTLEITDPEITRIERKPGLGDFTNEELIRELGARYDFGNTDPNYKTVTGM